VSGFQWVVAIALFLIVIALFTIADAVWRMNTVIVEVVTGFVANVRVKPIYFGKGSLHIP